MRSKSVASIKGFSVLFVLAFSTLARADFDPAKVQRFSVFSVQIDGSNMTLITTDPLRKMNLARVSPDLQWASYTRYNRIGSNKCATDDPYHYLLDTNGDGTGDVLDSQYLDSEILVQKLDGLSAPVSLTQHSYAQMNANSTPLSDGTGLVFVHMNTNPLSFVKPTILSTNFVTKTTKIVPTPANLAVTDPHPLGNWIAFAAADGANPANNGIYVMNRIYGTQMKFTESCGIYQGPVGANRLKHSHSVLRFTDPRLSPDLKKVAYMGELASGVWHLFVYDLCQQIETDLTASRSAEDLAKGPRTNFEAMPAWDPAAQFLVYWYIDLDLNRTAIGLLDLAKGRRQRIPLPLDYNYQIPAFYPGSSSRIIFTAETPTSAKCSGEGPLWGSLGMFDASQEDDLRANNVVWRAFSTVDPSNWSTNILVSTHIAVSADYGKTFVDLGVLNRASDLTTSGLSWVNEVPSLVSDPSDSSPAARWKIVWDHHLVNSSLSGDYRYGWIGMKAASDPGLSNWSPEVKLLAGSGYNPLNALSPGYPLFSLPASLSDCLALTEPGTLSVSDGFYMSFHCQAGTTVSKGRLSLVKFRHPTYGGTVLETKGNLLTNLDAQLFAATYGPYASELLQTKAFDAPDIFEKNGIFYLMATPINDNFGYLGCAVFQISNMERASIKRLANGAPQLLNYFPGQTGTFRGACTYSKNSRGSGVVLSQLLMGKPMPFSLVPTFMQIP